MRVTRASEDVADKSVLPNSPHAREFLRAFTRTVAIPWDSSDSSGGIAIAQAFNGAAMIDHESPLTDWTRLIQADYLEMPGLQLTKPQVCRLWGLDPQMCDVVLDTLVATAVLKKTPHQTYALVR